jgi:hypothetical protein
MFQSLCGVAVACAVTGQLAEAVEPTPPIQTPPPVFLDQNNGCAVYNCIGPTTTFRLPDEVPYTDYEQQYVGPPSER